MMPEVTAFIAACLKSDEESPSKQRHTARRIYDRLVAEKGFTGGESTTRSYVRTLKGKTPEAFVPLAFGPGEAVQIDWGESTVYMDGEKIVTNLFCARLCHSAALAAHYGFGPVFCNIASGNEKGPWRAL